MFSLTCGRPIAKTSRTKTNKVKVLSVVDPDEMKQQKKQKKCKKKCCKYCDEDECQEEPCCKKCCIYYQCDSDSIEECSGIGTTYESSESLIPLPDLTQRFVEYVAGPSGSGKTTVAAQLAMQFKVIFPDHPIYVFSRTNPNDDPAFGKLKPIAIAIDESLVSDPIDITQEIVEEGCLLIFDDVTTIHNEKIKREVEKLMADAMEIGRKLNCNIIITNHLVVPNEKKIARTILNELTMLTVFPKSGSSQQIRYALKTYFGFNNKQVDELLKLKSRWVRISKSYPMYVLHEHGSYIL